MGDFLAFAPGAATVFQYDGPAAFFHYFNRQSLIFANEPISGLVPMTYSCRNIFAIVHVSLETLNSWIHPVTMDLTKVM